MPRSELTATQRDLIESLTARLAAVPGLEAVVLGGSHARGQARAGSDIDLGLLYREAAPLSIAAVRAIAQQVNDSPDPMVTELYQWGPWVNGGSWLTIGGQRVDFLYKNLDQLERVIADARAGHCEHAYYQQPPFGYYADTFLSELQTCVPLYDPQGLLPPLQQSVAVYPELLRVRLVQEGLGSARFDLYGADKSASAGDTYLTGACLIRSLNRVVHALFALNRRYRVNDKTAFAELADAPLLPRDFAARVQALCSQLGSEREELLAAVERARSLLEEVAALEPALLELSESSPEWLKMQRRAGMA